MRHRHALGASVKPQSTVDTILVRYYVTIIAVEKTEVSSSQRYDLVQLVQVKI